MIRVRHWWNVLASDRWAPGIRSGGPAIRCGETRWTRGVIVLLACAALVAARSVGAALFTLDALHHINLDHRNLPDIGPFI